MTAAINTVGFVRLAQIIGNPRATPPVPPIYPVSATTVWNRVKAGTFPAPVKLGPKTTAWRIGDIIDLIEREGGAA